MKSKINVVIVDDQALMRQGIKSLLEDNEDIEVVHEASNGVEIIKWFKEKPKELVVDVVLMDMQMPEMEGCEATEILVKRYEDLKIIGLSSYNNDVIIDRFIGKGGRGYLLKEQEIEEIVDAIEQVHSMGYYFSERVSLKQLSDFINLKKVVPTIVLSDLSEREIMIVQMICDQLTTPEIADKLCISTKTVQTHRERIMQKIKAKNVVGIALYAIKHKLVTIQ